MDKYCYNCMNIKKSDNICEHCGSGPIVDSYAHHLSLGTVLNNRYMVGHAIGEGGFGITYIGRDLNLDMIIAIKEFYPNGYANRNNEASSDVTVTGNTNIDFFEKGKAKFIREARVLAKFSGNKSIVDVRDYFEDNNTAYIVMEYVDGMTLKDYMKTNGNFEASDIFDRFVPLCEALKKVHKSGLIHRDISPDNIMILKDGSLKLMDFGAARDVNFEDKKSLSIMLKPGYAPEEQYRSKGKQGSWTDIYAICATIYKCITGVTPDDSMERVFSDELKTPSELGVDITTRQEDALMKGMAIYQKDRFANIDEFISGISDKKSEKIVSVNISSTKNTNSDDDKTEYYEDDDDDKTEYYDYDATEGYGDDDKKTEHYDYEKGEIIEGDSVSKDENDRAKKETEEKVKSEAEEKAKREAEEKAKREAKEKAKREAEEKAKREAEEKAKREAKEKAKREAKEKAKREAKEKAKREAEEKAKRKAEEKKRKEADERAKQEEKEKARSGKRNTLEKEGGKSKRKIVIIGVSTIVAIIALFLIIGILNSNTKKTTVSGNREINVIGMGKDNAVQELRSNDIMFEYDYKYDDNKTIDSVVDQYYIDSNNKKHYYGDKNYKFIENYNSNKVSLLYVVLCKHYLIVPNLIGLTQNNAVDKCDEAGVLCLSETKYNKASKGTVIGQDKKAGLKIKDDDILTFYVSKGPKLYKIPNVKGDSESTAKNKLKKAKLKVSVVTEYSSSVSQGKVIKQSKKAGNKVKKNTKITITVSLGAKPTPTTRSSYNQGGSSYSNSGGNSVGGSSNSSANKQINDDVDEIDDYDNY